MARANTTTLLSLDRFAEILGLDPRAFNGVQFDSLSLASGSCDPYWMQYTWQKPDYVGREELARAIAEAEQLIADYLGYFPAPTWHEETVPPPARLRISFGHGFTLGQGLLLTELAPAVNVRKGYLIAGGRERWDLLAEGAAVVYSDPYGFGFNDLATVDFVAASSGFLGKEIALVPAGTSEDDLARYRIRNLRVTVTGGNQVHVEGRSCQFVDPALWEAGSIVDGDDPTSFLTEVDAYRRYNSSDGEDYAPVEFYGPDSCSELCTEQTQTGCLVVRRPLFGQVAFFPADWSNSSWDVTYLRFWPDAVRLYLYSGYPSDELGEMAPPLDRAVAALATARLDRPVCSCGGHAERLAEFWQTVPPPAQLSPAQMDCPFGPQNGAFHAYLLVRQLLSIGATSL